MSSINPSESWPSVRATLKSEIEQAAPHLEGTKAHLDCVVEGGGELTVSISSHGQVRAKGTITLGQDLEVKITEVPWGGHNLEDYREACLARDFLSAVLLGTYQSFDVSSIHTLLRESSVPLRG